MYFFSLRLMAELKKNDKGRHIMAIFLAVATLGFGWLYVMYEFVPKV
jgi:hypothetical protein